MVCSRLHTILISSVLVISYNKIYIYSSFMILVILWEL